jgi:hypothetical protein
LKPFRLFTVDGETARVVTGCLTIHREEPVTVSELSVGSRRRGLRSAGCLDCSRTTAAVSVAAWAARTQLGPCCPSRRWPRLISLSTLRSICSARATATRTGVTARKVDVRAPLPGVRVRLRLRRDRPPLQAARRPRPTGFRRAIGIARCPLRPARLPRRPSGAAEVLAGLGRA